MNLLEKYVSRVDFDSYQDFKDNFRINVPENFNFVYDVVDYYAENDPDKVALVWCNDDDEERIVTFAQMKEESNKMANILLANGTKKGDCVLMTLKGRYEFWYCLLGLHRIGAIAVPATHMLTAKDFVYRFDKAKIKMVISDYDEGLLGHIDKAYEEFTDQITTRMVIRSDYKDWQNLTSAMETASADFQRPTGNEDTRNDDAIMVYFSSGTTGYPKMVEHDFAYPLAHIITAKYWQNVIDDGLHYTVADTGWAKCVWGKIYGQWLAGSAVFAYDYEQFNAKNMLDKAAKYKVTTFCAPPTVYRFLIKEDMSKYDLSSFKYCVVAGEPLNPEVYNRFREYTSIKLMECYGQTETTPLVVTFPWMTPKPGSMGRPNPCYEVCLMNSDGKICNDPGEQGEIVLDTAVGRPLGLFTGYRAEPQRTAEVWTDGYYHTGDVAWKDEDGYFWFVGRADDVIKSSGYRIGPFEVESALMEHPAVTECAITGAPDPDRGVVVKATIVLTKGYTAGDEMKKELQNHVKKVTAPYKYPRIVEFVEELPKTISGKIRRVQIREEDQ
ncbi:MAG: AMP-binding protein [Sedimentisphaeraceae bacterium JB056]